LVTSQVLTRESAKPSQKRHPTVARPTDYREEFAQQAEKLCRLGATDYEVADFFGVNVSTIHRWKHRHPEFCDSLKVGKEQSDERVARSLYHRAVGYTYTSEKLWQHDGRVIRADVVEHVPPDVTAAWRWLVNRRPTEWRDRQTIEGPGPNGEHMMAVDASMSALEKLKTALAAKNTPADDDPAAE